MNHIHIHQPPSWLGRTVSHCTTCKQRRRFIVRLYEWYPSQWICGGCGYTFTSGEGREWAGTKERLRQRKWVADTWKTSRRLRETVRRLCVAMHNVGDTFHESEELTR